MLLIALAVILYAVTALLGGSGFLAFFVNRLVLGDADIPARLEIERFNRSLPGAAEIVAFAALGLTVDLTTVPAETWRDGAVLMPLLALLLRPLVVVLALARARLDRGDRLFIAWSGLKGAVPILLAVFAILGAPTAPRRSTASSSCGAAVRARSGKHGVLRRQSPTSLDAPARPR